MDSVKGISEDRDREKKKAHQRHGDARRETRAIRGASSVAIRICAQSDQTDAISTFDQTMPSANILLDVGAVREREKAPGRANICVFICTSARVTRRAFGRSRRAR